MPDNENATKCRKNIKHSDVHAVGHDSVMVERTYGFH